MRYCHKCGAKIENGDMKFCTNCGTKIITEEQTFDPEIEIHKINDYETLEKMKNEADIKLHPENYIWSPWSGYKKKTFGDIIKYFFGYYNPAIIDGEIFLTKENTKK